MMDISSPVCLVDIDGVVYPFDRALAEVAVVLFDRPLSEFPPAETWDFMYEQWRLTEQQYRDLYYAGVQEHRLFERGAPLPGSVEGWNRLRDTGHRVHVVTHVEGAKAQAQRLRWLEEHGFRFDDITFTGNKAPIARNHLVRGCRVSSVDDLALNVERYREAGAESYVFDQPWNRRHRDLPRVESLSDLAERLAASDQGRRVKPYT